MFFVISLLTNIIGPLVPEVIKSFQLSLTLAAFLPFSFFAAYAVLSIPAGILVEKWGEKPVMLGAFALALAGSLLFCLTPSYPSAISSLFLIGLGMAALQVAINPLLRVTGGEEHFAFNSVIVQLVFSIASFVSPLIYSHFAVSLTQPSDTQDTLTKLIAPMVPANLPWTAIYWIFSAVTVGMIALIASIRFPRFERTDDEKSGAWSTHKELLSQKIVWLFFIGVFCYVGLEQGLSNWMSQDLASRHGFDPQIEGAAAVSRFWGIMTAGCLLGLGLLKIVDSRKVLIAFAALSFFTLAAALFGDRDVVLWAYPATGFAISLMWSIVFSLALNSVPRHHGTFSGILCTGIVGGAIVPVIIGSLGDVIGLRNGLCVLFIPIAYIFAMGFWAKPLITNKTLS